VNTAQAIPTVNPPEVELIQRVLGVTLDQPAGLLCEIAKRMDRKRELNMEIVNLDMIADGIDDSDSVREILVVRDHWFDGFLASLNWWRQVSDMLLVERDYKFRPEDEAPDGDYAEFAHHREASEAFRRNFRRVCSCLEGGLLLFSRLA
jgi:hypothetical protein